MSGPLTIEWVLFEAVDSAAAVYSSTPGWKGTDYTDFRKRVRAGANRVVPGMPGRDPVDREWDEIRVSLPMRINGFFYLDGTPFDDPILGVDVNHQYLLDNVFNVLDYRTLVFHQRDGVEFNGSVVVDDWQPQVDPNSGSDQIVGSCIITIAAGMLTETGS